MAFPEDHKSNIIQKALNRNGVNLKALAEQENVGYSTLQRWLSDYKEGKNYKKRSNRTKQSKFDKIQHILSTSNKPDIEIGKYCREQGIYRQHLEQWREELMSEKKTDPTKPLREEIKDLRGKNKTLEKELRRKEKALAEATAILLLKKKAAQLFGEDEENY